MLQLEEFIGEGATRRCYRHPDCHDKCVKVLKPGYDVSEQEREIKIAQLTAPYLEDFMIGYEPDLVETNFGPGLVCDLICDADGSISTCLEDLIRSHDVAGLAELQEPVDDFIRCILEGDAFFYDFNEEHLLRRRSADGSIKIYFIDLESLNKNGTYAFLKLEKIFAPLARIIMFRRIRRMYRELGLTFPFDSLCRKKLFSSLFVRVKLRG